MEAEDTEMPIGPIFLAQNCRTCFITFTLNKSNVISAQVCRFLSELRFRRYLRRVREGHRGCLFLL